MTTIELRFPANRFHANPWGRHVNEAIAEWPPSPYRLLRALYDTWKRKHSDLPSTTVESLLQALAVEAPRYALPKSVASHTRSYLSSNGENPNDKSLIFDGFVAVDPGAACYMSWPTVTLGTEEREALGRLLSSLNYLGRSESWIAAQLHEGQFVSGLACEPAGQSEQRGEIVPVACVRAKAEYSEKRPWFEALTYSTTEFLKDRRSAPPAMQLIPYVRPMGAVTTLVTKQPHRRSLKVDAVQLALDGTVLPLVTATVEIAEQIRVRLMGIHKRIIGDPTRVSPKFSGKNSDGLPLQGHEHIFILPLGNSKGRIDRVLLYTRSVSGFEDHEMQAILGLRSLYQHDRNHPVRVVLSWNGDAKAPAVRRGSATLVSSTPFVTTRHWRKGRGEVVDFLKEEVRRECRNHRLPEPLAVDLLPQAPGLFEWIEFRRNRKDDTPMAGYGFRLRFTEAVLAPFSLGYGCHFGLGQFDAE